MSDRFMVRISEDYQERFKAIAAHQNRTNKAMLETMIEEFEKELDIMKTIEERLTSKFNMHGNGKIDKKVVLEDFTQWFGINW